MSSENMVILRKGGVRRHRELISPILLSEITHWQQSDPAYTDMPPTLIQLIVGTDERVSPSQRGVRRLVAPVPLDGTSGLSALHWGVTAHDTYLRLRDTVSLSRVPCLIDVPPDVLCDGRFIAAFMRALNEKKPKVQYRALDQGVQIFFVS